MSRPIIFMFSGQGSHYYQMGRALYENNQVFKTWILKIDKQVQKLIGQSIVNLLYHDGFKKSDVFNRTLYTHPSIFMVEYALSQVLLDKGIVPDGVLGASLGEFTSAVFTGVMSLEDTISAVVQQAKVLENCCPEGGMLAVLHDPAIYKETEILYNNSEIAAINFDSHFVISGNKDGLIAVASCLKSKMINYQYLSVSKGFHSSSIDPAETIYRDYLKQFSIQNPGLSFISCSRHDILTTLSIEYFWNVVRSPILFQKTIQKLENKQDYIYLDLGPSGTLATFAKYNLQSNSDSESYPILTPFGQDLKNLESIKKLFPLKKVITKKKEAEKMVTYIFPGQGSQQKGMGETLFDNFKDLTAKADEILGYSIKDLCLNDPESQLGQTQFTQPAIYVVNALTYLKRIEEIGVKPNFAAGHSLGEYNALFAAGAFDFETGLKLVKERGELMSQASGGGMAAVIGLNEDEVNTIIIENKLSNISIANLNTPSQIVIAGPKTDIDDAKAIFEEAGVRLYIPLKVSGAFHTKYMTAAKDAFKQFIDEFAFSELTIPVISNINARPYKNGDLKDNLIRQITSSVQWTDSIRYLMGQGEMNFEEVGPGKVLTGMVQKIQKEAAPLVIEDETYEETFESVVSKNETHDVIVEVKEFSDEEPVVQEIDSLATIVAGKQEFKNINQKYKEDKEPMITAETLGNKEFKKDYNLKYAYVTGGMYHGIASKELVARIGKAGMLGFFGTGGLGLGQIEETIQYLKKELNNGQAYGMNLLNNPLEIPTVDLFLKHDIRNIEAAAYMQITPALARYRLQGLSKNGNGTISVKNKIIAKVSRPEVAEVFLSPAPERIVASLVNSNQITKEQAELAKEIAMADDLCVEADSGGHTDQGVAYTLMPVMLKLRDEKMAQYKYQKKIRVGAAGGIGTPEAAAAAFILGADFILTGSINQCTVEAGTSNVVKELLQNINVQDTEYAPAGDMFEFGAKVQVVRKGVFFPARANKLYALYQHFNSLDEIDEKTKKQLQEKYFKRSFDDILNDCKLFYPPYEIEKAEKNQKIKMALIFKWYFGLSSQLALAGDEKRRVDFQIHSGPSLGAFNQWVKGTTLENWQNRHVDDIAKKLIHETADLLNQRFYSLTI